MKKLPRLSQAASAAKEPHTDPAVWNRVEIQREEATK